MKNNSGPSMKEWAVYKGDEFLFIGTTRECAERLGVKPSTVRFYSSPTYKNRNTGGNSLVIVDLGEWEGD